MPMWARASLPDGWMQYRIYVSAGEGLVDVRRLDFPPSATRLERAQALRDARRELKSAGARAPRRGKPTQPQPQVQRPAVSERQARSTRCPNATRAVSPDPPVIRPSSESQMPLF